MRVSQWLGIWAALLATTAMAGDWKPHEVRQLDGTARAIRLPAQLQIVTESWNRVVAVPYIVYMPEKDRLLMLVSCDYPHRPMMMSSEDHGTSWSKLKPIVLPGDATSGHLLGVSLTYAGRGQVMFSANVRCFSADYGETWSTEPISPIPGGGAWNEWDSYLVDRDAKTGTLVRLTETGYEQHGHEDSQAYLRSSTDGGKSWSQAAGIPQWKGSNEVALLRAANGNIVAACRTIISAAKKGETLDHYEGLGISISRDDGQTWSDVKKLYDWGRHHPSLLRMPNGDIVMTDVVRKGYVDSPDGFPQFGIEAVVSHDHGQTWDLDHKYILHQWVGHMKGGNSWWPSSQATSSVLLPDGSIVTAFGTGYRCQANAQGLPAPRDVGLVQWRLNSGAVNAETRVRDAPFDSDARNVFDPGSPSP